MSWSVHEYIREEVRRQGHNLNDPADGGVRVEWMKQAWEYATAKVLDGFERPEFHHITVIACMIEPYKNIRGETRFCNVRVGMNLCPDWREVPTLLHKLIAYGTDLSPVEWYKEFELIHPFVDGNGRTGKVILNWLSNTLDDPYFPPADLFGDHILNP